MRDLSIRARLASVIAGFVVVILVGSAMGLYGTQQGAAAAGAIYTQQTQPIAQLARLEGALMNARFAIDAALTSPKAMAALEEQLKALSKEHAAFEALPRSNTLAAPATALGQALGVYDQEAVQPLVTALKADDGERARALAEEQLPSRFQAVRARIAAASELLVGEARAAHEEAQWRYRTMVWVVIVGVSIAFLAVGWYGRWLLRSITQPLNQAVQLAERVAAGDLTAEVDAQGKNELAQLMQALQRMNGNLAGIVSQVRDVAGSIATGSAEIASGNADLSQRTEAQATNLQQTASAMEELAATVRQNADSSRQADELAGSASQAATQGGEVVSRVVGTMEGISDSSRKIADIVGLIDGVAFQTNILALNAAVEAARAGESGRGFAVVAGEVRSLAQRSASAAREIKTLIEKSVETVEHGSRQVHEAGQSMGEIVGRVQRVSSLIGEISTASGEQTIGIGRVSQSVVELDQVTQANAALVEQSAAAAESLKRQAEQLVQLVSAFKLRG